MLIKVTNVHLLNFDFSSQLIDMSTSISKVSSDEKNGEAQNFLPNVNDQDADTKLFTKDTSKLGKG